MLTRVLLLHVARATVVLVGLAALVALAAGGGEDALGVLAGGLLIGLDGAALIYLVGKLMDPHTTAKSKGAFTLLLIGKLTAVGGLLWACLSVWKLSGLGVLVGIAVGLAGLILGVTQGQSSDAGREAIERAEAEIRAEMGDTGEDSR